jgi:RND superfamily putative drug exporter
MAAGTPGDTPARRVPPAVRWLIPALLVVAWVAMGGIGGPYFGKISEVSSNDQTSYLPGSAQSTEVQKIQQRFTSSDEIPAIVVFVRSSPLTSADKQYIAGRVSTASSLAGVAKGTSPDIVSKDGRAAQVLVPITNNTATADTVAALATSVTDSAPSGLKAYVTGPAGQIADLGNAFAGIDGILLLVAVLAVLVILFVVYRSPLLPLFVLGTSLFALCASIFTVWWLAKSGAVTLNGQVQGILFILVIGAATDYSLLYVSRYREALRETPSRWDATWVALKGSIEPIAASAGTVIAGLLCLLLSELNSNRALGPVAAIGIVFAFVSAMSFLPALLLLAGRTAFWPLRPKVGSATATATAHQRGLWARLGRGIGKRPRTIWIVTGIVLVAAALGVTQLRAGGVAQSDLVEGYSAARTGQTVLGEHFPKGAGSPVLIVAKADGLQTAADTALRSSGVSSVGVLSKASPSGTLPVTTSGVQSFGSPAGASAKPTEAAGRVLLEATLSSDPDSDAAQKTVNGLRSSYAGTGVLVGGVTATAIDSNDAGAHDRNLIIPIVLVVILLILMLLLRAVVAAVLLILSVVVSFAASLGVAALVFNGIFRFPGADPAVPLYGFVFLVALGVDYNIFLMTRVREESRRWGTRPGVLRGLSVTGGVITSAGIVLAATFAALSVIPVLFLTQIAFIVSFGVLLDTIIVRSLLVPALMYDVGSRIWWPSSLARVSGGRAGDRPTTD